jgi:Putative zinc ribbon domain
MDTKCDACGSCGMPFEKPEDHALADINNNFCRHCADDNGKLRPYDAVLESNVEYYIESQGLNREAAAKMAKEFLSQMPAWKGKIEA